MKISIINHKKLRILALVLLALFINTSVAGAAASLFSYPKFHATSATGAPLAGGLVYTYEAGTTTAKTTYSDSALKTPNANPVVLDSNGDATIYLDGATKAVLKTSADVTVRTTTSAKGILSSRDGYEVDVLNTYGSGRSYSKASIDAALAAIGTTTKAKLLLRPGTWTIISNADYSAYKNITWKIPAGAVFSVSTGATLTLNGSLETGRHKIFTTAGTGKVVFREGSVKEVYPEWWTENTTPGRTDMTPAITRAINSTDKKVIITGTNLVDCATDLGWTATWGKVAFTMKSKMHLKGIPSKSIIKVKNGVSSDSAPVSYNIFGSVSDLDDISFDGITFDLNGANNLQSPSRPSSYNRKNSNAILLGTVNGRVDNLTVEHCVFKNGPGTNVIVVGLVASEAGLN